MFLQHNGFLEAESLKEGLVSLLHMDIRTVTSAFEPTGYTNGTRKITVISKDEIPYTFILKPVSTNMDYQFYQEVLDPYGLNSPLMYGLLLIRGVRFLVIEYIPHQPTEWQNRRCFEQAVQWLIKKDKIVAQHLTELRTYSSVEKTMRNHIDEWLALLVQGTERQIHPLLTGSFLDTLLARKEFFEQAHSLLSQQRQTIVHNDFQMHNILFGAQEKAGQIYVLDWSGPNLGSVCVDLAKLLRVAPVHFNAHLRGMYHASFSFAGFHEYLAAAQWLINLQIFAWMIKMLLAKREEVVSMPQLYLIYKELYSNRLEKNREPVSEKLFRTP